MSFPNSYVLHAKTKTKHFKTIKTETHSDKIMIKKKQIRKYTNSTCSLILCSAPHNLHVWESVLPGWVEKWMLCFWSKHKCGAITHTVLHVLCIPSALRVSLSNHDSDRWEDSDLFTFGQIHCSSAWHSTHHCQTRQCFKSRHVATCCCRRQTAVWSVLSSLWSFVAFEILEGSQRWGWHLHTEHFFPRPVGKWHFEILWNVVFRLIQNSKTGERRASHSGWTSP